MRVAVLRRWLRASPRALLVVLLAFAIEIVPAPSALVQHRHTHGDAVHVHVGRIGGGYSLATSTDGADAPHADGLYAATASGVHRHFASPVVVGAMPAIAPLVPGGLVVPLPPLVAVDVLAVAVRPGHARAPPVPGA